jgi:hypothetical protein
VPSAADSYLGHVPCGARGHSLDLGDGAGQVGACLLEGAPAPGIRRRLPVGVRGLLEAFGVLVVHGDQTPVGIIRGGDERVGHPAVQSATHAGRREFVRDLAQQLMAKAPAFEHGRLEDARGLELPDGLAQIGV